MTRRTLDLLLSAGGAALAALLLILGLVMTSNANFAKHYVTNQLAAQNITFKPAAALTPAESSSPCLVRYAGQALTTGKQAECYANDFIGLHLESVAAGMSYAEIGVPQAALRDQVAAAETAHDPALPALQAKLAEISTQRDTLFKGETLRGLLLTSFGFSVFGVKGGQVGTVAYLASGLVAVLALLGVAHGLRAKGTASVPTPKLSALAGPLAPAPANA